MKFNEIIEQIKTFENSEEFESYISSQINADRIEKFLSTDVGRKYIQPILDRYFSKGLETWKTNNLDKLIDAKVKELHPDKDTKDTKIKSLKAEIEGIRIESQKHELENIALKIAIEKKLPINLVRFFVGTDEKTTIENMKILETVFTTSLNKAVENRLKRDSYTPPN